MLIPVACRSDEEEEEEETIDVTKLRKEKEELLKKLEEIDAKLPVETPKESAKKGKQQKKLLKEKEDAEKAAALEKAKAEAQVSTQRKIEESDFENAQDLMGSSGAQTVVTGQGTFESWVLNSTTKLADVEAFSKHAAEKITTFEKEFLYISLLRTILQETTKNVDVGQTKELLLVLTKGKDGFNVVDLIRSLLRDADKDISPEDIAKEVAKEAKEEKAKPAKGKELAKLTSRQELLKLLLHDLVKDTGSEVVARIISEVPQHVVDVTVSYRNIQTILFFAGLWRYSDQGSRKASSQKAAGPHWGPKCKEDRAEDCSPF
jgi:hypothetical protein